MYWYCKVWYCREANLSLVYYFFLFFPALLIGVRFQENPDFLLYQEVYDFKEMVLIMQKKNEHAV